MSMEQKDVAFCPIDKVGQEQKLSFLVPIKTKSGTGTKMSFSVPPKKWNEYPSRILIISCFLQIIA